MLEMEPVARVITKLLHSPLAWTKSTISSGKADILYRSDQTANQSMMPLIWSIKANSAQVPEFPASLQTSTGPEYNQDMSVEKPN